MIIPGAVASGLHDQMIKPFLVALVIVFVLLVVLVVLCWGGVVDIYYATSRCSACDGIELVPETTIDGTKIKFECLGCGHVWWERGSRGQRNHYRVETKP